MKRDIPERYDENAALKTAHPEAGAGGLKAVAASPAMRMCRLTRMGLLVLAGLLASACVGGPADRAGAVKMVEALKGKTKQELLACAGAPKRESLLQGLTAMVYQEEAELVELSVPGAKSSGARSVPHSCRATVILEGDRVTDVRFESMPAWLGAEDHCEEIFARCAQ